MSLIVAAPLASDIVWVFFCFVFLVTVQTRVQGSWLVRHRLDCQAVATPVWHRERRFRSTLQQKHHLDVPAPLPLPFRRQGQNVSESCSFTETWCWTIDKFSSWLNSPVFGLGWLSFIIIVVFIIISEVTLLYCLCSLCFCVAVVVSLHSE